MGCTASVQRAQPRNAVLTVGEAGLEIDMAPQPPVITQLKVECGFTSPVHRKTSCGGSTVSGGDSVRFGCAWQDVYGDALGAEDPAILTFNTASTSLGNAMSSGAPGSATKSGPPDSLRAPAGARCTTPRPTPTPKWGALQVTTPDEWVPRPTAPAPQRSTSAGATLGGGGAYMTAEGRVWGAGAPTGAGTSTRLPVLHSGSSAESHAPEVDTEPVSDATLPMPAVSLQCEDMVRFAPHFSLNSMSDGESDEESVVEPAGGFQMCSTAIDQPLGQQVPVTAHRVAASRALTGTDIAAGVVSHSLRFSMSRGTSRGLSRELSQADTEPSPVHVDTIVVGQWSPAAAGGRGTGTPGGSASKHELSTATGFALHGPSSVLSIIAGPTASRRRLPALHAAVSLGLDDDSCSFGRANSIGMGSVNEDLDDYDLEHAQCM